MVDQPAMVRRVAAAQATLDRFKDKPFKFGTNDCVRMTAFHLRKLGYQLKLPHAGSYGTARAALRELRARGFQSLAEAMDSYGLERIPPASAVAGDIIMIPGEGEFGGALQIALGNGRTVGYHQDVAGATVLQPLEYLAAWRAEPVSRTTE